LYIWLGRDRSSQIAFNWSTNEIKQIGK
jgi:hypothetical protein